jgi:hypothetical protein
VDRARTYGDVEKSASGLSTIIRLTLPSAVALAGT